MHRNFRADAGRASFRDYEEARSYGRAAGSYPEREPLLREPLPLSGGYRSGGGYERDGFDRDVMDSLIQQRALQQQLSLRESQLALASSLLTQQQYLNKRSMDRGGDYRQDFKRPRLDERARPRDRNQGRSSPRSRGFQGSGTRGSGNRGPSNRRNQRNEQSSRSQSSARKTPKEQRSDEKKTETVPKVESENDEGTKKQSGSQHKDNTAGAQSAKGDKTGSGSSDKKNYKYFCRSCDVDLTTNFATHARQVFHKKRKMQVSKGCGWCSISSFENFSQVLKHRETQKHLEMQKVHEGGGDTRRSSPHSRRRKRNPIRVDMPEELKKFDPKVVTGQSCVIAVTGWFCKLCNKFYNNETAAKETHCMTEQHFTNFKKFTYSKLRTKAIEEREAKEKAEEEERKKKKEAEAAEKEKKKNAEEGTVETGEKTEGEGDATEKTEGLEGDKKGAAETEERGAAEGEEGGDAEGEEGGAAEGEEGVDAEGEEGGEGEEELDEEEDDALQHEILENQGEGDSEALIQGENQEDYQEDKEMTNGAEAEEGLDTLEADAGEEGDMEETADDSLLEEADAEQEEAKKATRAAVSSPARGRGRGGAANRARRGRKTAK